MFQNYLKIAYRHLLRNKSYVLINVVGIGLAMTCCIIGYLNWKFDANFDSMHTQKEQLFRIESIKEATGHSHGWAPLPLAKATLTDFTEVEDAIAMTSIEMTMKNGEKVFNERPYITNTNFFDLFDFPIKMGDKNALNDPNKILISESCAKKYFGTDNPIGQSLTIYAGKPHQKEMEVGAVIEDMPLNSSLQFPALMNMENLYMWDKKVAQNDWSKLMGYNFLKLKNPSDAPQLAKRLSQYTGIQNSAHERWKISGFHLESMTTMAHNALNVRDNWTNSSLPIAAVWGPVVMAILLLLTACLNFANTSISLSNRRLKEMGVRKVMGSSRQSLIAQILAEGLLICLFAMVAGVVFTEFFLPYYNDMWPYLHLTADYFSNIPLVIFMAGTVIVTTLLAGAYPAFYMSSFDAANIFRGGINFGGSNFFSRLLLGIQITISLVAVITGVAFAQNTEFQKNADLGYVYKDVITIPVFEADGVKNLQNKLKNHPQITHTAGSDYVMDLHYRRTSFSQNEQENEGFLFKFGQEYLDLLDMNLKEGRFFQKGLETDAQNAILVNETFAKSLGNQSVLNAQITIDSIDYAIVGVVEDFYYEGFWRALEPCIIQLAPEESFNYLVVRADESNLLTVSELIQKEWATIFPTKPYEGLFQTELTAEELMVTTNVKWTMLFLALIAILLTATGLFALVSLNILKRMKEIAIRKVVGASTRQLAMILHKNFLWIFLLSAIIGSVGGTYLTLLFLDSIFYTNSGVSSLVLTISTLTIFVISGSVISLKIREVAVTNPADILRSE